MHIQRSSDNNISVSCPTPSASHTEVESGYVITVTHGMKVCFI